MFKSPSTHPGNRTEKPGSLGERQTLPVREGRVRARKGGEDRKKSSREKKGSRGVGVWGETVEWGPPSDLAEKNRLFPGGRKMTEGLFEKEPFVTCWKKGHSATYLTGRLKAG